MLPLEIGKQIAFFMVELFKNEFWLLQENSFYISKKSIELLCKIDWNILDPVLKEQGLYPSFEKK